MRLREIEEKLSALAQRRWGSSADLRVHLDEGSEMLIISLPDGTELSTSALSSGALLTQASALLARHLEQHDPWAGDQPRGGDMTAR